MRKNIRSLQLLLILSLFVAPVCGAQTSGSLTLAKAVQMALRQNPRFLGSQDAADAAHDRTGEARAAWYPRIDFSQEFTRGDNPVYVFGTLLTQRQFTAADFSPDQLNAPHPLDNFQTRFAGQLSIFDSGETWYRTQGARRLETAADFEMEQARQDLIFQVVKDYYDVIVARENLRAAQGAVKTAESNEGRVKSMQKAGLVVDADLLSAQVFLAQMKDREIRIQNKLEISQMSLGRDVGLASGARPMATETLTTPTSMTKSEGDWVKTASQQRPALLAAQMQAEASTSSRKAVRAEFGPKVGLYADFERDAMTLGGPSGTNWTAGARLDFNLFAGGAQKSRLAEAEANERKSQHDLAWFRSGVMLQVRQAYLDASAAAQRATTAHDAVEQARESLRIIQNRYQAGLTNITELLRAQTAQLDARTEYLSALHDWQIARVQLNHAAGTLTVQSAILQTRRTP